MPWELCRLTTDLVDDGAWHGLERASASAPDSTGAGSIFFPVGTQAAGSAVTFGHDQEVMIRVGWCGDGGTPVEGQGTSCSAQPVTIDSLPHPVTAQQRTERLSVGAAVANAQWAPLFLRVGPAAWCSVRLSGMDAGATGGTRAAVWYWARG